VRIGRSTKYPTTVSTAPMPRPMPSIACSPPEATSACRRCRYCTSDWASMSLRVGRVRSSIPLIPSRMIQARTFSSHWFSVRR